MAWVVRTMREAVDWVHDGRCAGIMGRNDRARLRCSGLRWIRYHAEYRLFSVILFWIKQVVKLVVLVGLRYTPYGRLFECAPPISVGGLSEPTV